MSYMGMKEITQDIDRKNRCGVKRPFPSKRLNIPKVPPLQHIQLSDPLGVPVYLEDGPYKAAYSIYAKVTDMTDQAIVDACIEFAKAEGINDLYLLDREFVKAALLKKAAQHRTRFTPGEKVWVVERDEDDIAHDIGSYRLLAEVADAVILTPYVHELGDLDDLLRYHIARTRDAWSSCLDVFPAADCYNDRETAVAALEAETRDAEV